MISKKSSTLADCDMMAAHVALVFDDTGKQQVLFVGK